MSDHIKSADLRKAAASCDDCKSREKIKTPFARIIVGGTIENPYFEILYFDNQDKCFRIGFGSYCLAYVFQWLSEEFEIAEGATEIDCDGLLAVDAPGHLEGEKMTLVQALKVAVAVIECDAIDQCADCYLRFVDCDKVARESAEVIKHALSDAGYQYPGEYEKNSNDVKPNTPCQYFREDAEK